jgi:hypothetical protein
MSSTSAVDIGRSHKLNHLKNGVYSVARMLAHEDRARNRDGPDAKPRTMQIAKDII